MQQDQIIEAFQAELRRAGVTPRDISSLIGVAHTTIYRVMAGRFTTSKQTLRSLQMITKFLRQYKKDDLNNIESAFEFWLIE